MARQDRQLKSCCFSTGENAKELCFMLPCARSGHATLCSWFHSPRYCIPVQHASQITSDHFPSITAKHASYPNICKLLRRKFCHLPKHRTSLSGMRSKFIYLEAKWTPKETAYLLKKRNMLIIARNYSGCPVVQLFQLHVQLTFTLSHFTLLSNKYLRNFPGIYWLFPQISNTGLLYVCCMISYWF